MLKNRKILVILIFLLTVITIFSIFILLKPLATQKNNYSEKTLEFDKATITIRYKDTEDDFFLDYPVKKDNEGINSLETLFGQYGYIQSLSPNSYVVGNPDEYKMKIISIVSSENFKKMEQGLLNEETPDNHTSSTICEKIDTTTQYTSLKCKIVINSPDGNFKTDLLTTTGCFLKANDKYYIRFEQHVNPNISTEEDMCEILQDHEVSVVK